MAAGWKNSLLRRALIFAAASGLLTACGGGSSGGGATPVTRANDGVAKVKFVYVAPVAVDTAVQNAFVQCYQNVAPTHIHPSWLNFVNSSVMIAETNRWTKTYNDVPVDALQRIRINDPNNCDIHKTGATTTNIFANGIELTNVVGTPGTGTEPGLSFTVTEDGTVTP